MEITYLVIGGVLLFLAIYIPYRIIKWAIKWVFVRINPFSDKRMVELECAIQGIGYHVYQKCIIPFGQDIKGKPFKSIDWNALKEKHRYPGYTDEANFYNEIFFGEVDEVLKNIERQLDYINDAWVRTDYSKGGPYVANYVRKHIKSDKFPETYENYVWLDKLGRECADAWNEQVKERKIQSALDGEYEAPEAPTQESYHGLDDDDSSDYGSYEQSSYEEPRPSRLWHSTFGNQSSSQPQRQSTPQRQPAPKQTYAKPEPKPQYYVERMGPGQYGYQKVTGGDGNIRNAQRRLEQSQKAHSGSDNLKGNASKARYRIVDKNGKVQ